MTTGMAGTGLLKRITVLLLLCPLTTAQASPQSANKPPAKPRPAVATPKACLPCIRADMSFLAGDDLRGRGSGTHDELLAANYIASVLMRLGVEPAAGSSQSTKSGNALDRFIQPVTFEIKDGVFESRNIIGKLTGSDPKLRDEYILLSAHLDHLGIGRAVNGDDIYNGADDNASGVAAVLELARALASGPRPRRTLVFALFGSEEKGLLGARYFLDHPTVPILKIVANLEFEMIARPDTAVARDMLWLTGWDRSNLGPELARRGARLAADPHPEQEFFSRSDNYALAKAGVVAHTVSSFGLHSDYHQPSDDLSRVDWDHMARAIGSLIEPIRRLANSDFRPKWAEGKKP